MKGLLREARSMPPPAEQVDVAIPPGREQWATERLGAFKKGGLSDADALRSLQFEIDKTPKAKSAEEGMKKALEPASGGYQHNSPAKPL